MLAEFDQAIARIPRWILVLALTGTILAGLLYGLSAGAGYLIGSLGAWVNFRIIEGVANRVARQAKEGERAGGATGTWVFIQFTSLVLAALAIIMISGFSRSAAFCGFLITPAAVILEILYELVALRH